MGIYGRVLQIISGFKSKDGTDASACYFDDTGLRVDINSSAGADIAFQVNVVNPLTNVVTNLFRVLKNGTIVPSGGSSASYAKWGKAAETTYTDGADTVFAPATVEYDNGAYTTGQPAGKFIIPSAGLYLVSLLENAVFQSGGFPAEPAADPYHGFTILVNGSVVHEWWTNGGRNTSLNYTYGIAGTCQLVCAQGDLITATVVGDDGSAGSWKGTYDGGEGLSIVKLA